MFNLIQLEDTVTIPPDRFGLDPSVAIIQALDTKYSNKLLPKKGLAICTYALLSSSALFVYHTTGDYYTKVTFDLIMFAPFRDEILVGKIKSASQQGIRVSMVFFDDIYIDAVGMQPGSSFDGGEGLWVWRYGESELWMDLENEIRFRVEEVVWGEGKGEGMSLKASIKDDGLGLLSWWQ